MTMIFFNLKNSLVGCLHFLQTAADTGQKRQCELLYITDVSLISGRTKRMIL